MPQADQPPLRRHDRSPSRPAGRLIVLALLIAIGLVTFDGFLGATPPPVTTVELRDITVAPGSTTATITFLVSGRVGTVVVEPRENGVAHVRMKSVKASRSALASARTKPGVTSIKARIERGDVLVTDVRFTRGVRSINVLRRDSERVVLQVSLSGTAPATSKPAAASKKSSTKSSTADAKPKKPAGAASSSAKGARSKWTLATIVIDAGHGGKDPGAIGIGGVKEKDVTLAVALKLKAELKKRLPGRRIVMTRESDKFVELYRRGQIANASGGRLFISIHCNSMPQKPHAASGFECYILRPGKSEEAARVVAAENGAIRYEREKERYRGMGGVSLILASMAQSAFARFSEEAAGAIRTAMRKALTLPDRGVHQAGFYVLIGASMPSVLLEIGYLSNTSDARILASADGQTKISRAIANGIVAYDKIYSAGLK